jgi:hypothetical protein
LRVCGTVPGIAPQIRELLADAVTDFRGNPFEGLYRMVAMETPNIKRLESGNREPGAGNRAFNLRRVIYDN